MLHLQKIVRGPLNVFADLVAMSGPIKKRPQDEHVQRALKKVARCCVCFAIEDIRPSMATIVDIRPSIVKR